MGIVNNPVMAGFYPDPSVCHVDTWDEKGNSKREYYMVHSTFSYVPGLPIFRSNDLCSWEWIGHVLTRKEQLALEGASMSQGLYAPCIRYHKGTFYVTCTNVSGGGNFYVSAKDPSGEWSNPIYLKNAEGIDPSLYFEGDTCYYIGQRTKEHAQYNGDCEIWLQELDVTNGKLTGEVSVLWDGALKHAIWPEGPHLYKKGAYYYLVIAEGGTAYSHSICVARSKHLRGPYEPSPNNPVFTHRHLGNGARVQNVGHCDLVEEKDGSWYAFMLGTRPIEGTAPLGRETFVAEVQWQEDWPVFNPCAGMLRSKQQIGNRIVAQEKEESEKEEAEKKEASKEEMSKEEWIAWREPLDKRCLFFRYPEAPFYHIKGQENINAQGNPKTLLALEFVKHGFANAQAPAYIGIRVTSLSFGFATVLTMESESAGRAGIVYLYDEKNYIALFREAHQIGLYRVEDGMEELIYAQKTDEREIPFSFELKGLELQAYVKEKPFGQEICVAYLTSEKKGGFVGCTMGVYAEGAESERAKGAAEAIEESTLLQNDIKEYAYFSGIKVRSQPYF